WELRATDPGGGRAGIVIEVDRGRFAEAEAYRLVVGEGGIRLTAGTPAGAFRGTMTLGQLLTLFPREIPALSIEDSPDFPRRGVMLDISRNKVPTLSTLKGWIEMLAAWKVNEIQLYMEHTFAYADHPEVWEGASPLTGEEVLELDHFCRERYIDLVPNQNSFGHMARWLQHPRYAHLAEAPEGFTFPWGRRHRGPFSLAPTDPGSLALLESLYAELLPHFSSEWFNVGLDETFDLGQGRSREACEARGADRVYLDFLQGVYRLVRRHGKRMQFWGDIVLRHPERLGELPPDVAVLVWGYEADHPFDAACAALAGHGIPFYVCPGTSSWISITGRTENALENLRNAAEAGRRHGALGYLVTDWGDYGHWQHLPVSFPPLAYGAALAWAGEANREVDLARLLDCHRFLDTAGVTGRTVLELGNAYRTCGALVKNGSVLARLLLFPEEGSKGALSRLIPESLERCRAHITTTLADLSRARMACSDGPLIVREIEHGARLLLHACRLGIERLHAPHGEIAEIPPEIRREMAVELDGLIESFRELWLARNRPGGLSESIAPLEALRAAYG
ncbi:MAG: glycoside hydrolase, partial [Deltaproteobacteria bacterium]